MSLLSPLGASRSLAAVFTPIRSGALVEEVAQRIEAAVETGLLASGQRLPNEAELAAALGVSGTTAREALARLRAQGMIRTVRGRNGGSVIAENVLPSPGRALERLRALTRLQLSDLGLHYRAIATACAAVAARRSDAADVERLRSFVRPVHEDPLAWRLADSEFLLEVAAVARSARMARELLRLQAELGIMTLLPYTDAAFRDRSVALRAGVADAIESRDADLAVARTEEMVRGAFDWLLTEQAREAA